MNLLVIGYEPMYTAKRANLKTHGIILTKYATSDL